MTGIAGKPGKDHRFLHLLNHRIIKTSYTKSVIYFIIAVVLCLLLYFWMTQMPMVY